MPSPPASTDDTSTHGQLFLIAAGTARYDHLPDKQQLPSVNDDLRHIVDFLRPSLATRGFYPVLVTIRRAGRSVLDWGIG